MCKIVFVPLVNFDKITLLLLFVHVISFVSVLLFPGNHLSITDLKSEENVLWRLEVLGVFAMLGDVSNALFDVVMVALTVEVVD